MGKQLNISVDWKEKLQFLATNDQTHYKIDIDTMIEEDGGEKMGTGAKHLFLQSIAACTGQVVVMMLRKLKAIMPNNFQVRISGELTEEHPMYFKSIRITYIFEGQTNLDKIMKAIQLSEEKYCGLTYTVAKLAEIETMVILNEQKILL